MIPIRASMKLGSDWHMVKHEIAFNYGLKQDISLSCSTRFDGNGNAVVRFIVAKDGKETSYEKFDSAVDAYELLKQKG